MSATPKTRPPMTDDQLAKLAVAREKALVVRRAQKVEKLKAEAARLEAPSQTEEVQPSAGDGAAPVDATPAAPPPSTAAPAEQQTPEQVEPAPKAKGKKKATKQADPVVVVEQSSDDDDTFEAPPGVIFVKRRRAKPKNESEAMPQPAMSEHDMAVEYAYRRMVNGEFHTGRR